MACQMKEIANFIDVETVKKRLFPVNPPAGVSSFTADSWVWPDDDLPNDTSFVADSWLQDCQVSLSSAAELLVISHESTMVILTSKWVSHEEGEVKSKYNLTWHGNPSQKQDEKITSVLCLSLISQGKSTHCGPDWTCIVVGFSSGFVRFYTENCNLLMSELLHNTPVVSLKCQAYQAPQYSTSREPAEEIYVLYDTNICIIPGFGLFQTLRACRNQLARVQANCVESMNVTPLTLKKWGFQDEASVCDCAVVGAAAANSFDQLLTASVSGGFSSWYRSSAPQTCLMLTAGKKPFLGFHYALEGGASPILTDMAKVVANKLKSAIGQAVPTWLMVGRRHGPERSKEIPIEPADQMGCRFGLCDQWRHGNRLVTSPNRNMCVVCDSLGRIILIDNQKGIAVRMWKGYREAQCGWLEVREESRQYRGSSRSSRTALFLVIYSPRKGLLEIWTMQQGPRVATFPVSKTGRLIYIEYGFMGVNSVELKGGNKSQYPCVFVDPSGLAKEVMAPFHCALSAKNRERVRDLHLLKKLKTLIREEEVDDQQLIDEVYKMAQELKTSEVRCQALEMLATNRAITPDALDAVLKVSLEKWLNTDGEVLDPSSKLVAQQTLKLGRLVTLYRFIHQMQERPPDYATVVNNNLDASVLSTRLHTPQREVSSLLNLVATVHLLNITKKSRTEPRVTFDESKQTTFVEFLSCFESNVNLMPLTGLDVPFIFVKKSTNDDALKRISELLYQGTLYSECNVEEWRKEAAESCIQPSDLMLLALHFWLHRQQGQALETEMLRFAQLLKAICSLADMDVICVGYNQLSPWWRDVRNYLQQSTNPFMALTAAIVCRAVALTVERDKERASNLSDAVEAASGGDEAMEVSPSADRELTRSRSSTSDWENVSSDTCQWSVLIGQLEDVTLLSAVLGHKPPTPDIESANSTTSSRYCLPFERPSISLKYMLSQGKGTVSELTARWLSTSTVHPTQLVDLSDIEFDSKDTADVKNLGVTEGEKIHLQVGSEASTVDDVNAKVLGYVSVLKRHFPYSLSSSVLVANLCWEFVMRFHKSDEDLRALEAGIICLQSIPSHKLRQGLCNLVWSMHLKQRFEAAAMLIEKVGKVPRERLCRQEVRLTDTQLPLFFEKCLRFFDIFMESCCMNDATASTFQTHCEEAWASSGPPPLSEVALSQPTINYDLLYLHYQLGLMLYMQLVFNIRFPRPVSTLFDNSGQAAFFADLSSNPHLPSHNPDTKLTASRTQFLFRVISAAMQTIRLPEEMEVEGDKERLDSKQAVNWMSKCHSLGAVWSVSGDVIRRHQICELYSSGYDCLAEEAIPGVVDMPLLASQLMLIVGQRMRHIVISSSNLQNKLSKLSPALSTWLDSMSLENNLKNTSCPLADTLQLLAQVMQYLPEDHQEYNLALHMVDALNSFKDSEDV